MVRTYQFAWFRADLAAGLVLAALLVPQGMAYAELAGLPAVTGLYTTVVCLVTYAIFGPSRILVLGPDSAISPLIFAAILPLVVAGGDPAAAIAMAGLMALMVGLIEIGLAIGKLGFVASLISKEVQVGYMNGLAITIIVGQIPKLFGFSTDADSFFSEVAALFRGLSETNPWALAVGCVVLLILLILPRFMPRVPAVLVGVVVATIASAALDLSAKAVAVTGSLPQGFPVPAIPWVSVESIVPLLVAAVGITVVSLGDTIATTTGFAARHGDEVDPDQEMIGIGTANIAAGFFQGFAISTSASRTAVAEQSGAKTQVTGLVGAGVVLLMLLFFNSVLADLPQAALGAVVIGAALTLFDFKALRTFRAVRPSAFAVSLIASAGVIVFGVLYGIVIAIVISVLMFFRRNWWPHGEILGRIEGSGWHSITSVPDATEVSGVVVYRWEAPLFFANASIFQEQVRALVKERTPRGFIVQSEAITDVDITAADVIIRLTAELGEKGIELVFVEMRDRLVNRLQRGDVGATTLNFLPQIDAAVATILGTAEGDVDC